MLSCEASRADDRLRPAQRVAGLGSWGEGRRCVVAGGRVRGAERGEFMNNTWWFACVGAAANTISHGHGRS